MWLRSTATPRVIGAGSYSANSEPAGNCIFNSNDNGCPIPPAAPSTAIFMICSMHQPKGLLTPSAQRPPDCGTNLSWRGGSVMLGGDDPDVRNGAKDDGAPTLTG